MNVVESYKKTSQNFHSSLSQSVITTLIANDILKNWPNSLPSEIREPLILEMSKLAAFCVDMMKNQCTRDQFLAEFEKKKADLRAAGKLPDLYVAAFSLLLINPRSSADILNSDFTRVVHSQALVMLFAHLDAFLSDSMRIICQTRPAVLKCDKKMTWADIVSYGQWPTILDRLIEDYVFEFGWKSLRKRLEILNEQIGLRIGFTDEGLQRLEAAELVRHLVTHNGGNINQKYIDVTGQTNFTVGQPFPLDAEFIIETNKLIVTLGIEIFTAIMQKFYKDEPIHFI
jgi:hypothetical protein